MTPTWIRVWYFKYKPAIVFDKQMYVKNEKYKTHDKALLISYGDVLHVSTEQDLLLYGYKLVN